MAIKVSTAVPCKTVVHVSQGLSGLKTPLLGEAFLVFVENVLKCPYSGFYGAEFKFLDPNI